MESMHGNGSTKEVPKYYFKLFEEMFRLYGWGLENNYNIEETGVRF